MLIISISKEGADNILDLNLIVGEMILQVLLPIASDAVLAELLENDAALNLA